MKKLFLTIVFMVINFSAFANVSAVLSTDKVNVGEVFSLVIIEELNSINLNLSQNLDLSVLEKDFEVISTNKSMKTVMVNGSNSTTSEFKIGLSAKKEGRLTIPSISVNGEKTPELYIEALPVTSTYKYNIDGQKQEIFVKATVDDSNPFEQSQVIYILRAYVPISISVINGKFGELVSNDAIIEPMNDVVNYESKINNVRYLVFEGRYAVFPTKPGKVVIDNTGVNFVINEPNTNQSSINLNPFFKQFGGIAQQKQIFLKQDSVTLDVKSKPDFYKDKVWLPAQSMEGEFLFPSSSTKFKVGDPIDISITLKAKGLLFQQIPDLTIPEIEGLKVYPGKNEEGNFFKDGANSFKKMSFAIIPTKSGEFVVPKLEIPWYNTVNNKNEVIEVPEFKIKAFGVSLQNEPEVKPEVVEKEQISSAPVEMQESTSRGYDDYLVLLIGICGGIGIALFFGWIYLNKSNKSNYGNGDESYSKDLRVLKNACELANPRLIQEALLNMVRNNIDAKLNNLTQIADYFMDEKLKHNLEKLNQSIYSNQILDFDSMDIYKAIQFAMKNTKQTRKNQKDKIPNLYPF